MDNIGPKNRLFFSCLILALLTLATYWQVTGHEFIELDDADYISDNPQVQAGLTLEGVRWAFTTGHASNWHPLTWLSHMLDVQLYGMRAGGHHLTSLLLHLVNSILLLLILHRMTKALWPSALVAALFALHPLHVESVAWASERKDVLSTLFWMLTMGAYGKYVEQPGPRRYLLTLISFALGLMAKPMLVTLPVVLLLLDFWPLNRVKRLDRRSLRPLVLEKVPFLVLAALSSGITLYCQQGAMSSLERLPPTLRLGNALTAYVRYIGKSLWPTDLSPYYPHPGALPAWEVLAAATLLAVASFLVIRGGRRFPYLISGWLWYLVTLVPVIGIVQVGGQSMADRYTYVPLIGLAIILAWGLPEVLKGMRHRQAVLAVSSGLLVITLSFCSWRQIGYWRDNVTLFGHALEVTENNAMAHATLGKSLIDQARYGEAIGHLNESLRLNPVNADAHNNLGVALQGQGDFQAALVSFGEALRLNPHHARAHGNMGDVLRSMEKSDEAVAHYTEAIRSNPYYLTPYANLGGLLASQGSYGEALTLLEKGLGVNPDSAELRYTLGSVMAAQGRMEEAVLQLREVVRLQPDHVEALNDLGSALALQGKIDEAIEWFRDALRHKPGDALTERNLKDALELRGGGQENSAPIKMRD